MNESYVSGEKPACCLWHKIALGDVLKVYRTFDENSKCLRCTGFNEACKAYTPVVEVLSVDGDLSSGLEKDLEED